MNNKSAQSYLAKSAQFYLTVTSLPYTDILVRGDSGFATPDVYDSCEENSSYYVIRLKNNRKLGKIAEKLVLYGDNQKWAEREFQYFSTSY